MAIPGLEVKTPIVIDVIQKGNISRNIAGMGKKPTDSYLATYPYELSYFYPLNNQYNLGGFSFLFCDVRTKSVKFYGALPQAYSKQPAIRLKDVGKYYYSSQTTKVSSNAENIVSFDKPLITMFDSGEGSAMLFPEEISKKIITYIKKHTGMANRQLPQNFWAGEFCIARKNINFDSLPVLNFHMIDTNGKDVSVSLPPEQYISINGCGSQHMVEMSIKSIDKKLRAESDELYQAVVGLPFLQKFLTTFRDNEIDLRDSTNFCVDSL